MSIIITFSTSVEITCFFCCLFVFLPPEFIFLFSGSKINLIEVIEVFFLHPSGSSWPPLAVCAPTLEATGLVSSSPQFSVPQEPPCPALTFLYLPRLSRTLCSSPSSNCPPPVLCSWSCCVPSCPLYTHILFIFPFLWDSSKLFQPRMMSHCSTSLEQVWPLPHIKKKTHLLLVSATEL